MSKYNTEKIWENLSGVAEGLKTVGVALEDTALAVGDSLTAAAQDVLKKAKTAKADREIDDAVDAEAVANTLEEAVETAAEAAEEAAEAVEQTEEEILASLREEEDGEDEIEPSADDMGKKYTMGAAAAFGLTCVSVLVGSCVKTILRQHKK